MRIWWQQHHEGLEDKPNRKWAAYFEGATPRPSLLKDMYADYPSLKALFDNPLWLALSDDAGKRQDWDCLAEDIRVGGQPLGAFDSSTSSLLFSRVDWPCLGLMIILLRTRSNRFALHRKWLQMNFSHFFYLACLQAPLRDFYAELYSLLNSLLSRDFDLYAFKSWPGTVEEFKDQLEVYYYLLDGIKALNWLDDVEAQRALLLWILIEVDSGLMTYIAVVRGRWPLQWPLKLRRIWLRQSKLWKGMPIALDGYQLPAPL
ncbi:hypothetical protein ACYZT2_19070 [Pseudomonas sp. MDT1-85]